MTFHHSLHMLQRLQSCRYLPKRHKRKYLTPKDRMTVIKHYEGDMTAVAISYFVYCNKIQIQNIIKKRDKSFVK